MQKIQEHFQNDPEVAIVAIQTTFEGFMVNTFGGAKLVAARYGLKMPIGQSGSKEAPSVMMRNYRTGGTPWVVIIDKKGIVRFNNFNIDANAAIEGMETLKKM